MIVKQKHTSTQAKETRKAMKAATGSWKLKSKGTRSCWPFSLLKCKQEMGFPRGFSSKEFTSNAGDTGDTGLIPGLGRFPGEGHGNPLQYSCLENLMDRWPWRDTESQTWLKQLSTQHKQETGKAQEQAAWIRVLEKYQERQYKVLLKVGALVASTNDSWLELLDSPPNLTPTLYLSTRTESGA